MATLNPCPRCSAARLTVIYYDADGQPLGGRIECTDCGPRHAIELRPQDADVRERLLNRKAS
jgi:hypothetical protein